MEEKLIILVIQRTGLRDIILLNYKNTEIMDQFMNADRQRVRYTSLSCVPKEEICKEEKE
jgi:hypothetical protein